MKNCHKTAICVLMPFLWCGFDKKGAFCLWKSFSVHMYIKWNQRDVPEVIAVLVFCLCLQ